MKNLGMAKVWRDIAEDDRVLLRCIAEGHSRRSYSATEISMLKAEATRFELLAAEFEAAEKGTP